MDVVWRCINRDGMSNIRHVVRSPELDSYLLSSGRGDRPDLLKKLQQAVFHPVLGDFAIHETIDVNVSPADSASCWGCAHELALMRGGGRTALDHSGVIRDQILLSHNHVRKGVVHHSSDVLEALKPRFDRRRKMMPEVLREQVVNSINIVLVFEGAGMLSDGFHIRFD